MATEALLLPLPEFGVQICQGPCGRTLPFSEFHELDRTKNRTKLGYRRTCKTCYTHRSRDWNVKNPDRYFDGHLRRNFGITLADYNAMLDRQGGVCAICGGPPTDRRNRRRGKQLVFVARLVVDHDHDTGRVRGLLCGACNSAIGFLKDDPATVRSALAYLERG